MHPHAGRVVHPKLHGERSSCAQDPSRPHSGTSSSGYSLVSFNILLTNQTSILLGQRRVIRRSDEATAKVRAVLGEQGGGQSCISKIINKCRLENTLVTLANMYNNSKQDFWRNSSYYVSRMTKATALLNSSWGPAACCHPLEEIPEAKVG